MLMMKRLPHTRVEFEEIGGIELVQQVLRTPQAAVGYKMADVRDDVTCCNVIYWYNLLRHNSNIIHMCYNIDQCSQYADSQ